MDANVINVIIFVTIPRVRDAVTQYFSIAARDFSLCKIKPGEVIGKN